MCYEFSVVLFSYPTNIIMLVITNTVSVINCLSVSIVGLHHSIR